jgi:DnaJ like chaperone protein
VFYGKLVAGLIGLLVAGPIGLLIGLFIGHLFDRGLRKMALFASPEHLARVRHSFFDTTFLLLGHLAKADGQITRHEIDHTEMIIAQLQLDADQRREAIEKFREGARPEFQLEPALSAFLEVCGSHPQLRRTLLVFLLSLALADHHIDAAEHAALARVSQLLGFSSAELERLLAMVQAQESFHRQAGQPAAPAASLADAYAALGVSASDSDQVIKRAYRKLMSANHPDKLIARGVPEDMIRIATEKSQEIQAAYDMIKRERQR